jgi:autotransporter-associated beta strand protein
MLQMLHSFAPAVSRIRSNKLASLWTAVCLVAGLLLLASSSFAQTNFAALVSDGAWTWFNDPRALFNHGNLYFGYVRDSDGSSCLNVFNLQSGQTTNLWVSSLKETDDHDVCGLLPRSDGLMLAIYSRHQTDQFFTCRLSNSTNPVAPADWGPEYTNTTPYASQGMTYSNPYQLTNEAGKVYNFARNQNYNPCVFTSTNGGSNWTSAQILILTGTGSTRPYVKYCSDYNSRIDFLYTDAHPDNYTNSLYHMYYTGGAFYMTDGTFLKSYTNLPLLHDSGERGTVIYQYSDAYTNDPNQWIPTGRAWCWEIAYQTNGWPVCVFQAKVDNVTGTNWFDARIYYYYARWTGTNWQKRFIAQAGRPLYDGQPDYGGGMALDPQDPNTIYIATDAATPFDLSSTTNAATVALGANYQIWKGVTADGGLTFNWQAITGSSTVDNLRPYIPRRFGGEPCVLWFRGTYTSYTSWSAGVVGLFTTVVPQTNSASGTWNVDADGLWSIPGNWLNGISASGAGNIADFSTLNITADRTVTLDTPQTIGTLRFGDPAGLQNWTVNSSSGAALTLAAGAPAIVVNQNTATLSVSLAGTNGFTKSGPGTLVLNADNSFSGTLNLDSGSTSANDGVVCITSSAALGSVASPINFRDNTGGAAVGSLQLDGSAGGINVTQNFSTACRNNNTTPTFESLAGTNTLAGTNFVQVGGTNVIYQADAGSRLQITAPMQYVGTLTAARTFTFTGAGDLAVSGAITVASNNVTPIGVMKTGNGTLTLSGVNTYTNGTIILGGTLICNGSVNLGRFTVTGGALGGTGTIGNAVTIQSGGTIAPGSNATGTNSIGTLTINNALTNTGVVFIRLNKSATVLTNSTINGLSTFFAGGTLSVSNAGPGIVTAGDSFKLFSAAAYKGSFAAISPALPGIGLAWNTTNLAVNGTLAVIATVPPQFSAITPQGAGQFQFTATGAAGVAYDLEAATNLLAPIAWTLVTNAVADQSGSFQFMELQAANFPQRFYRIKSGQ